MATLLFWLLIEFSIVLFCPALPHPSHHQQQQLLLRFKAAVSNNGSSLPDWIPLHHFCNWTGVTCHSKSHSVRAINLYNISLDGTISPVLGNLSSLRSLDLSFNNLNGIIPPQLAQLPNLWILWLNGNLLEGTIPPELGNLSSLRSLDLSDNYLVGGIPPQLGHILNLGELWLQNNQLKGTIPPALSSCRSLYNLLLSYNRLHGSIPPELSLLTSLNLLFLGSNSLTGTIPPELSLLTSLKYLYLGDTSLTGTIPPSFKNMSSLVELKLGVCNLSGTIPSELGMLSHLQILYLHNNTLSGTIPGSLTNLSKLNDLGLYLNRLSGHIPCEFGTLYNLVILRLWGNQLSGNIPKSLGNCSSLEVLSLNQNHLGGTVPNELGKLNHLTKLFLHHNRLIGDSSNKLAFLHSLTNCSQLLKIDATFNHFSGVLPPSISQLSSKLQYLDLGANMISGNIPEQIVNLTNLALLSLGDNLFSGNIPSGIKRIHKLERLYLVGNKLEGSIPSEIGQMQYLGALSLHHNQLSGKIPDSLCSSQQLRRLFLQHNKLSGNIPVRLEECQNLELIDLSYNKLGGSIPRQVIASLVNLQFYIDLSWNFLEGSLPQEMSKLIMAQAIRMSGNKLSGVIPNSLGECTELESLNLSHNAFVGEIPTSLSRLKNLEEVDLSFNDLSGQIPKGGLFPNRTVVALVMGNPGLCGPKNYSLPPCPKHTQEEHSLLRKIVFSMVGTIGFVLFCCIIGMLWKLKLLRQLVLPSSIIFQRLGYPKFSYQDLVIATSGFDEANLLGVGNYGSVYKGILRDGKVIAIKILNLQNDEALKSFKRECQLLGKIRHRNLIRIITAFFYPDMKGLVLEFASNGSLEKRLYRDRDDEGFGNLGLSVCLSMAVDVAHGIEYLHHDCPLQIVHCDLKPSNVLLDSNMTALVTDFGISRLISTPNPIDSFSTATFAVRGSIGYIAPEYGLGGNVSIKGDVYSFGILILEMVTRKKPSDEMFVEDMSLHNWVRSAFPNRLAKIVDRELLRDVNENMEDNKCLLSFIHVGLICSVESPGERPSMRDVAKALQSLKTSMMGGAAASSLTATISELLERANPTQKLGSDSQSSTF